MAWFRKKIQEESTEAIICPSNVGRVEVERAKEVHREAKEEAEEVNTRVKVLIVKNHFTLRIEPQR